MTSTPVTPSLACLSTGMPRPLSETESEPSSYRVATISSQKPAMASSAELSITSCARWLGRSVVVYIPGRLRTGSNPVRTSMEELSYADIRFWILDFGFWIGNNLMRGGAVPPGRQRRHKDGDALAAIRRRRRRFDQILELFGRE